MPPNAIRRIRERAAERRAKEFVYDWFMDTRYVVDGERTIACSRAMFQDALTAAFIEHAEEALRATNGGGDGE